MELMLYYSMSRDCTSWLHCFFEILIDLRKAVK